MKKSFLFFALLAGLAVMTGCQKDQDVVTLKAVISQDTKAYFGGSTDAQGRLNLPYWDEGDVVYVKGQTAPSDNNYNYSLAFPDEDNITTFATIRGVPESDVYCAIFPASMVRTMETPHTSDEENNISAGTSALVYFEPHQMYKETNGHQQVDMPMGAVTEDNTLIFKNLGSIIRLTVTNQLANSTVEHTQHVDFDVKRITVQAAGAYLSGFGNVTLSSEDDPVVNMNVPNHILSDNVLSVYKQDGGSMGTIYRSSDDGPTSKTFDIVVPPFTSNNDLIIEVEMYNHADGKALGYYEYHVGHTATVGRNMIIPVTLGADRYTVFDYAYLAEGTQFNAALGSILNNHPEITFVKFNYDPGAINAENIYPDNQWDVDENGNSNTPSTWVELQAPNSPHKIYGYITTSNPTVLEISSFGAHLYCHSNCSTMFQGFSHMENLQWTTTVYFETEDVTNMESMFAGCSSLWNLPNIGSFNTTNVTTMAHMFDGCEAIRSLDLSSYNTHNLTGGGMAGMFNGCSSLQVLNLSSFTTNQITDMSNLFNGCRALGELYINNFDMTNVTNKANMCLNLAPNRSYPDWPGEIWCPSDVQTAISDAITGIGNVSRFVFHTTTRGNN